MKKYLWLFALDFMCFLGKVTLSGFKERRMSKLVNGRAGHLLVVLAMLFLTGCGKVDLLSNLPEKEANEILSVMQQHNISVSKKAGAEMTWTVTLNDKNNFSKAVEILNAKGYPNTPYVTIGQVFQKSGLVSSPLEERARYMYALSEDISQTLSQIPGVLQSRVHIVLPEKDAYTDAETPASAAVFLTYKSGGTLDESVREIKYLVANSVQGLDYDRVSIALFPVSFDDSMTENIFVDENVNVMGFSMSHDSASKFLVIILVMFIALLGAVGVAVYLFIKYGRSSHGKANMSLHNSPVVVQQNNDNSLINELDEMPDDTTK